ncbi:MAG: thermonuclease family protein [Burkholderiales bacterium]|nr:thermonuclease family protein [Burkholderiales bacterium]
MSLWLAFGGIGHAQYAPGQTLAAKVVVYASGSAFAVLDPNQKVKRVKLTGIDAPERKQRFTAQARQLAAEWLSAKPIAIAIDAIGADERIHGRVDIDGRDVGLILIEAGLAWCDPSDEGHLPATLRQAYRQACDQAKTQRRGLWQDAHPTPPWEYRKMPEFDALPSAAPAPAKHCRDIGYDKLQCEDGTSYRALGNRVVGSDDSVYWRRGNTVSGSDGNRYHQQGTSLYGTDGSVCRARGRRIDCH